MGIPARAAVEAPEGERAPKERAAARFRSPADDNVCRCCAAMVGMRLSALRLPLVAGGESIFGAWS